MRRILDHRRWLDSDGRVGTRLEEDDLNLTGYDLDFVDLSRARLPGADFGTSSLRGARFVGVPSMFDSSGVKVPLTT